MKARKVMNLDRSGACTHGPGTTNLYPANIRGGGGPQVKGTRGCGPAVGR